MINLYFSLKKKNAFVTEKGLIHHTCEEFLVNSRNSEQLITPVFCCFNSRQTSRGCMWRGCRYPESWWSNWFSLQQGKCHCVCRRHKYTSITDVFLEVQIGVLTYGNEMLFMTFEAKKNKKIKLVNLWKVVAEYNFCEKFAAYIHMELLWYNVWNIQ